MMPFLLILLTGLLSLASCMGPEVSERRVPLDPDSGNQPNGPAPVSPDGPPRVGPVNPVNPVEPQNPEPATTGESDLDLGAQEARFVELVNAHRRQKGCPALKLNPKLMKLARDHSRDMASRDFFSHTNPDGQNPFDRMKSMGLRYRMAAENIAFGQRTAEQVIRSWLGSSGHRKNIENCSLKEHGIGHHPVTHHWTHVFATLR